MYLGTLLWEKSSAWANRAELLQLMGGTLPKLQCMMYRPEQPESVGKYYNKDRWIYCGKSKRGSLKRGTISGGTLAHMGILLMRIATSKNETQDNSDISI